MWEATWVTRDALVGEEAEREADKAKMKLLDEMKTKLLGGPQKA